MGFFAKGVDGRIDDPNVGWKGKGLSVTSGNRAPAHIEGIDAPSPGAPGKTLSSPLVVHFQLRPIRSRIEAPGVKGRVPPFGKPTAPAISMKRRVFAWGSGPRPLSSRFSLVSMRLRPLLPGH
jgi:hypothetical protein